MAEIISINKIRNEKEDEENNVFAIRHDDGELKDMTEWTGDDWKTLIDGAFAMMEAQTGIDRWDIFADFIADVLGMEDKDE